MKCNFCGCELTEGSTQCYNCGMIVDPTIQTQLNTENTSQDVQAEIEKEEITQSLASTQEENQPHPVNQANVFQSTQPNQGTIQQNSNFYQGILYQNTPPQGVQFNQSTPYQDANYQGSYYQNVNQRGVQFNQTPAYQNSQFKQNANYQRIPYRNANPQSTQFNQGNTYNPNVSTPTTKRKLKIWIPIVSIALIVAIILIVAPIGKNNTNTTDTTEENINPDFNRLYNLYCSPTWATIGSDSSYLTIDTNPYDLEDNPAAYPTAFDAIKIINEALGLPESLTAHMIRTTYSDGRQSKDFEKQGVNVSWRYHPDWGLEVIYTKIN